MIYLYLIAWRVSLYYKALTSNKLQTPFDPAVAEHAFLHATSFLAVLATRLFGTGHALKQSSGSLDLYIIASLCLEQTTHTAHKNVTCTYCLHNTQHTTRVSSINIDDHQEDWPALS